MKDQLSENQTAAVLKALDDAIQEGPWDESNFLKVIGKNLREIRDQFAMEIGLQAQEEERTAAGFAKQSVLRRGQQEIFIVLYSSEGSSLFSWERILANLPKQMISRPIYALEQHVIDIIKTKDNKINEAYVSMNISENDILEMGPDKISLDKLGKPLLALKNKSLNLESINRFVHESGTYRFNHGRLVKGVSTENK